MKLNGHKLTIPPHSVVFFRTDQAGSPPVYTATLEGGVERLSEFADALCRGAWNGSENALHPYSISTKLPGETGLTPESLAALINTNAPAFTPREYTRNKQKHWSRYTHTRFWTSRPSDQWSRWAFYWVAGFRPPGDYDPQDLPKNAQNTTLILVAEGTKLRLTITGGNEVSVRRRMAAALGEEDVAAGFEVMQGVVVPLLYGWQTEDGRPRWS